MSHLIYEHPDVYELHNPAADTSREDIVHRMAMPRGLCGPVRISADVLSDRITGVPGTAATVFFNVEYADGPIFWDTFLYPDTGSTPWRRLAVDVRDRGEIRTVELHIRMHAQGTLRVRNVRIEAIEAWPPPPDVAVLIFGDSTDMTCYLPTEHRLGRRLELLLRDRFDRHTVEVHALAEGGETIQRVVDTGRLERELACMPRGDFVIIRYGLNDENQKVSPETFRDRLQRACELVHARFPQAQILLATTIPPSAAAHNRETRAVARERGLALIEVDHFLRERSAAGDSDWHHQRHHHIGRFRSANPADDPTGLAGDKHPNMHGAEMLATVYFEALEERVAQWLKGS